VLQSFNLSRLKTRQVKRIFTSIRAIKKDRYFNRRKKRCLNKQRFFNETV
jgi:hypothetical protein